MVLGQYGAELVVTWWYLVSKWCYRLVIGGTGSVYGGTSWYLVVLGQYRAVRVDIWCYWVSMKWNLLIHDNTGSVKGGTGLYLVVLGQCNLALLGIKWNWVSSKLYACTYWKSGDLVGKIELLTQPMDHGRLRWATTNSEEDLNLTIKRAIELHSVYIGTIILNGHVFII